MVGETVRVKPAAKTIAKLLNVPFAIVDATVFTELVVGEDVESILTRLCSCCNYMLHLRSVVLCTLMRLTRVPVKR